MKVEATSLPGVLIVTPDRHSDDRGFLSEVYHRDRFRSAGIDVDFVQDNHTFSSTTGTGTRPSLSRPTGRHRQTGPSNSREDLRRGT